MEFEFQTTVVISTSLTQALFFSYRRHHIPVFTPLPCNNITAVHTPPGLSMAFPISGLVLAGAGWDEETKNLAFSRDHRRALTLCQLRWTRRPDEGEASTSVQSGVAVPVYLHGERSELILTVHLPAPKEVPSLVWRQRGVALLAWSPPV